MFMFHPVRPEHAAFANRDTHTQAGYVLSCVNKALNEGKVSRLPGRAILSFTLLVKVKVCPQLPEPLNGCVWFRVKLLTTTCLKQPHGKLVSSESTLEMGKPSVQVNSAERSANAKNSCCTEHAFGIATCQ